MPVGAGQRWQKVDPMWGCPGDGQPQGVVGNYPYGVQEVQD